MQDTEVGKMTAEVLEVLAEKFGTNVAHLWGILVKQATISGYTDAVLSGVLFIVLALSIGICVWAMKRDGYDDEWIVLFSGFVGVASLILAPVFGVSAFKHIANPEYYALLEVLNAVGK